MDQMHKAVKIAEFKYPKTEGWKHVWIFDHSSCHAAMADDSMDVSKMNVNPGGKQRAMRDGWWGGKPQSMNYALGIPKGLRVIVEERGVNTKGMNSNKMREVLGSFPDFKNEKSRIERFLTEEKQHIVYMLPKYYCELNPIERVWASQSHSQKRTASTAYLLFARTSFLHWNQYHLRVIKNTFKRCITTCSHTWRAWLEAQTLKNWSSSTKKPSSLTKGFPKIND